jgi:hypothetical protein
METFDVAKVSNIKNFHFRRVIFQLSGMGETGLGVTAAFHIDV